MNDPERLLLGATDEHERSLLAAAASEEPSAAALARVQRTLGLTVGPAPLTGLPRPADTSPASLPSRTLLTSRWLLLGSAGLAVVGALALGRATRSPRTPAASSPVSAPAPAPSNGAPTSATLGAPAQEPGAVTPSTDARDPRADDSSGPAAVPPALREEVLRLERARTQLRSQRAPAAESALDEYDRLFPHGTLREEALALRIEALLAQHERARASELAASFFATYPDSVHGTRLRKKLEPRGAR